MSAPAFTEDWYPAAQSRALAKLYERARGLRGAVVEIGCWEGKSTIALANAAYPEVVVCNDTWAGSANDNSGLVAAGRDVFARFEANMAAATKGNYRVERRDCFEWLASLAEPVKFCHLDADHHYDSVRRAIALVRPLLVPGGILCGDDFRNASALRADLGGGVERAVREALPGFGVVPPGNLWFFVNTASAGPPAN